MATITGTSVGGMTLQIVYSYSQNTTANTTTVSASLQLTNHYALYASALSGSYISVGGSRTDYSTSISYGGSSTTTTTLATKTVTVSHNNDGTGSCNLSGTFVMNGSYRGYSVGTMSVSSTITLPTIPRASGLTTPANIDTGTALSGTISPSSSAFNHKVELKIGGTLKDTITLSSGTNSFSYTVPHSWFPNTTSGTVTVVLSTYSGSTFIASTSKNVVANVPSSIVPSVSGFTAAIATNGLSGLYVQGKTTVKLTASASAGNGGSISSYTYSGPDVYTTTTSNNITTSAIQASGTLTYYVQVTDSRGRTASKSVQIYVYPYSAPAIGSISVQRCDANGNLTESGTYAKYTVNSTYSNVGGKNTRTVTAAYSSNNGTSYSAATTLQAASDTASSKTGTYGGGAFALANAYLIKFTITDSYGATSFDTRPLLSAARPINIRPNGKGVAIGGMSTKDEFECSLNADFNKNVNIDGNATVVGTVNGANISGDTYINGGSASVGNHEWVANSPSFIGTYSIGDAWYNVISVRHRNGKTDGTNYGMQIRSNLTGNDALSWRQQMNKTWSDWRTILDTRFVTDYVVEQGTTGIWTYRKWNSGIAECWGKASLKGSTTMSEMTVTLPFTFSSNDYTVNISPSLNGTITNKYLVANSAGNEGRTTTNFIITHQTNTADYSVYYMISVSGRWK